MFFVRLFRWLIIITLRCTFWILRRLCTQLWRFMRWLLQRRLRSHGSARWANIVDLLRAGVWGRRHGLIVAKKWTGFIRHRGEGAVLVFAPMGSGKGVGLVIPNLLDHPGSVICTDPKGENFAVTGRFRATLGPVFRIDAQHPELSHHLNPFDLIRVGSHHEADDIAALADLLVIPESADGHWDTSARQMIAMIIGYVIRTRPPPLWTLATVRQIITLGSSGFAHELELMANCGHGLVEEEARITLAGLDHDETRSVIKNTAKTLQFWSPDRIGGFLTARSDFDLMQMHTGVISVFVVVPEDKLKIYQPFLRLMIGCALAAAVRGKALPRPRHKPLLLIDELAALGRLDALEQGIGYLRAYTRTLLVLQDLGQLRRIYGADSASSFLAASGCQVAFNVNDNATAQELAETIGRTTVMSRSHGTSQASTELLRHQQQAGQSESGRLLYDPSEIRRMRHTHCLVMMGGAVAFPILARKVRHYRERVWRGLWDLWLDAAPENPPASSARSPASSPTNPDPVMCLTQPD
ncbi:conjugal transfer protein TraG (plasmid) [Mesorhizobium sp. 131-2-5]|uniref:type IV secretory system conjugative DNA transfer family protein n=1 Tax=Mesorhizobium sp. 131-2-5 TaxID=2744519 RepID=UPI0018EB1439|nr:type IV secretory system conjugative DNA transfer family protein [Mesorhizobium sp. 131-2-5]BCH05679.1 conjugal transfer protein TraG [Mesorhizobium sp. 131-2-5]